MTNRRARHTAALATQSAELAWAVPQVMAHRLTRMAMAGPTLSPRDQREFTLMVAEKGTAFQAAWLAMAGEMLRAQQAMWLACWSPTFWASAWRGGAARALGTQAQGAALGVARKGLAPVHRKAVANARRLANTPLR